MVNDQLTDSILWKYEEKISTLGFQLRDFVFSELKDIVETPDNSANVIGYGYGPGYKNMICTIIPSKKGIKLGFYKGGELPDAKKLLTGTGKVHKYVEIKSEEDMNDDLKTLMANALKKYKGRKK
jgi:hypothetical protein